MTATVCENCSGELERTWKYCVWCGAPVSHAERIPGAIRPPFEVERDGRSRGARIRGRLLTALGLAAIVLLAAVAVVLAVVGRG